MERFVIIVHSWKLLTIITKRYILDVAAALDPASDLLSVAFLFFWLNDKSLGFFYLPKI